MKTIRSQLDSFDADSLASGIAFDPSENMTRQEFKDETDINWLLNKYGALPQMREPQFQDVDYDMDLLTAYEAVRQAQTVFGNLPHDIREKFGSWESLAAAMADSNRPAPAEPQKVPDVAGNASPPAAAGTSPAAATPA